jgi:AcrR family transcriptional regulator
MRSNNKRSSIIDAAIRVVELKGANHLTIDAVADETGLSKGGLLYHFPSKRALLAGMLERLLEDENLRFSPEDGEGGLLALLQSAPLMSLAERKTSLAIVAAVAEDPELLAPAREFIARTVSRIVEENPQREDALTLFLALEGMRFLDIFELNPLTSRQSSALIRHMVSRAEQLS